MEQFLSSLTQGEIIGSAVGVIVILAVVYGLLRYSSLKSYLVYAVSVAEQYLGSGTGQLKLQYVYNMVQDSKLGFICSFITFKQFSKLVDKALVKLGYMLEENEDINKLIVGVKPVNDEIDSEDTIEDIVDKSIDNL